LYFEIDNVSSLPQKKGFPDRASFDMYIEIKNKYPDFDKEQIKSFTIDFASHFKEKIYSGWQDYNKERKNLKIDIKLFLAEEKYEELHFENDEELINKICERIIQHYDDLWIDCAGDGYAPDADGDFSRAPSFVFDDGELKFHTHRIGNPLVHCGSVSGFVPQS